MKKSARALLLGALALGLSGCGFTGNLRANPGFASFGAPSMVRDTDREFGLSLGPIPMRLATMLSRPIFRDEDRWVSDTLSDIRAVRVYSYDIEDSKGPITSHLESVTSELEIDGWEPIAVVREDGGLVSAMVRSTEPELIRGVVVIFEEDDDLVLVNVIGKIEPDTIGEAMASMGFIMPPMEFSES